MENSQSKSYAAAGVDITAGYKAVELMKSHIARTATRGVCSDVGGFGGLFELDTKGMENPVLVSGTDGVGTKLKLAFLTDRHGTVGIDCVAMCVNDIICCGARPLFFLDYIAGGKNEPEKIAQIVSGVAEAFASALSIRNKFRTAKQLPRAMLLLPCPQAEFIQTAFRSSERFLTLKTATFTHREQSLATFRLQTRSSLRQRSM